MEILKYAHFSGRYTPVRAYVGALIATGVIGMGAWGQAVEPVNVGGQPPRAAGSTPAAPTTPTAAPAAAPAATASTPAAAPTPRAAAATETASEGDGKSYPVSELKVSYKYPHAGLPELAALMDTQVTLGVAADGYVAPRGGLPAATIKLSEIGKAPGTKLYKSAIRAIYSHILKQINAQGIIGVFVVVSPDDITELDVDARKDRTSLSMDVVTSVVAKVRTVAIGEAAPEERIDNPRHKMIRDNSPLQPAAAGVETGADLLRKDELDEYVLRLNRFAGRRVDVAISGTDKAGQLNLDYLVSENRPWYAYVQVSNTGTSQTADIRERFGFVDNQLTGHDDVLTLDYMTADFSQSHAVLASYMLPFLDLERVRLKFSGAWSEYTASDVGQNQAHFTGTGWSMGAGLTANFYQHRELFIDAVGGVKVQESQTTNVEADTKGLGLFVQPYIGLRLERATDIAATNGGVSLMGYLSGTDKDKLAGLGRVDPAQNPVVLQFDFSQSVFLEPLLDAQRFADGKSTLAHELWGSMRGQYAFDNRLVPQAQDVAGGLYSVRGYPESVVAGDSLVIGTVEYRFHLPRVFPVQSNPMPSFLWAKDFKVAPQTAYGRPDWDLLLRAFVDAAQVNLSKQQTYERNTTLVGTGLGLELQFKQNFNLRVDWGIPLTDVPNEVKAGSSRVHISATVLY